VSFCLPSITTGTGRLCIDHVARCAICGQASALLGYCIIIACRQEATDTQDAPELCRPALLEALSQGTNQSVPFHVPVPMSGKSRSSSTVSVQSFSFWHFLILLCPPALPFPINSTKASYQQHLKMQRSGTSVDDVCGGFRLGYVTDVEGNLDYFKEYVSRSNVLDFEYPIQDDPTTMNIRLKNDNCYFVFGGDAVDKGSGDIRLCRALVALKQRYPDRVYLLVGNRDLNKVRYTAELSDEDMKRPIDEIPPPHWDPKAPTLRQYLEKLAASDTEASTIEELNTRVNRLKYMLEHTLGCPKTFEFRRKEVSILKDVPLEGISDDEVLENILHEIESPEGSLREYLEHANVAVQIGNTLFCHGAVDRNTMKYVPLFDTRFENPPSKPPPKQICEDLPEWIQSLNDYLKNGLLDYQNRPYWNIERTSRGGESLMALQNRPAMWGRSIISNCYGDGGCITTESAAEIRNDPERIAEATTNPLMFENVSSDPMDTEVAEWLLKYGVQRVVVGHKPTGDGPAVLSAGYTGVEVVSADTSFSDTSADDNRGKAINVVEISGDSFDDNHLEISGTLRDGEVFFSSFPRLNPSGMDQRTGDPNLGRQLEDGWWVKAATPTHYQLCRGQGRKVEYQMVPILAANDFKVKVRFTTPFLSEAL
jgi:hypothetical protein